MIFKSGITYASSTFILFFFVSHRKYIFKFPILTFVVYIFIYIPCLTVAVSLSSGGGDNYKYYSVSDIRDGDWVAPRSMGVAP